MFMLNSKREPLETKRKKLAQKRTEVQLFITYAEKLAPNFIFNPFWIECSCVSISVREVCHLMSNENLGSTGFETKFQNAAHSGVHFR